MKKSIFFLVLLFYLSDLYGAYSSLEIATLEIQPSYNSMQRFPGKILPLNFSKLAFAYKLAYRLSPSTDTKKLQISIWLPPPRAVVHRKSSKKKGTFFRVVVWLGFGSFCQIWGLIVRNLNWKWKLDMFEFGVSLMFNI